MTLEARLHATAAAAVKRHGLRPVAQLADLDPAALSRFLDGQRSLSLKAASKLADALELVLVPKSETKPTPTKKRT